MQHEHLYQLLGLDYPASNSPDLETQQTLTAYSAPGLFINSAERLQPDFTVRDEEAPVLGQLCRALGGNPLAIELAAGWTELLSINDIFEEIEGGLRILETTNRDIPSRQRSMTAVFEASLKRLASKEQRVLIQMAVFQGGFTRTAAQEITGATLPQFASLVGKSLIVYHKDQDRFAIHRLLHHYLAHRLAADPHEQIQVQDLHCFYYCRAISQWEKELDGSKQAAIMAEMQADQHNLVKAWSWAVSQRHLPQLDQAGSGLFTYFDRSGDVII